MKVFLHSRPDPSVQDREWTKTLETFEQIPRVGEYVCREAEGDWFRVQLVVWLAESAQADAQVELYATSVDRDDALERETADDSAPEETIHDRPTLVDADG